MLLYCICIFNYNTYICIYNIIQFNFHHMYLNLFENLENQTLISKLTSLLKTSEINLWIKKC